jgi:hypothetical protein
MRRLAWLTACLVCLAFICTAKAAVAIECPTRQTLGEPTPPAVSAELTQQLAAKYPERGVHFMLGYLRQQFPFAPLPDVANYLIAAYCPIVKENSRLSEAAKRARLRTFADRVLVQVY